MNKWWNKKTPSQKKDWVIDCLGCVGMFVALAAIWLWKI